MIQPKARAPVEPGTKPITNFMWIIGSIILFVVFIFAAAAMIMGDEFDL